MTPKPKLLEVIDVAELREAVQEYIDYFWSDERHEDADDNYEHAIYEKALEAIMGKDIYDKTNARIDELENDIVSCQLCDGDKKIYDPNDPRDPIEGNKLRRVIDCPLCVKEGRI